MISAPTILYKVLEQDYKPGSVIDNHLSWPFVAKRAHAELRKPKRATLSGFLPCIRWGLHVPAGLPPPRWAFTPPFHPYILT